MKKCITFLTVLAAALVVSNVRAEEEFSSKTIDLGVVVSDIDAAVKFYTEAVGFKEVPGFKVNAAFAKKAGLTKELELDIKVLVLGEGEGATKLKLMQIKGAEPKKNRNKHIHTTLGFSYITVMVKSTDAALARLEKAGVKPIAKGPATLPDDLNPALALTIVRDPDGNMVELVGPKPTK